MFLDVFRCFYAAYNFYLMSATHKHNSSPRTITKHNIPLPNLISKQCWVQNIDPSTCTKTVGCRQHQFFYNKIFKIFPSPSQSRLVLEQSNVTKSGWKKRVSGKRSLDFIEGRKEVVIL